MRAVGSLGAKKRAKKHHTTELLEKKRKPTYYEDNSSRSASTHADTVRGVFSYSGRGFGFCVPDAEYGMDDVFIPPRLTKGAMSGDTVTVSLLHRSGSRGNSRDSSRVEGEVTSVQYSCRSLIGTLTVCRGYAYVIPDNKRFGCVVYVPESDADTAGAKNGDKVEVVPWGEPHFTRTRSITVRGPKNMPYFDTEGRIATVFGSSLSKEANYSAILYSSGIRTEFPSDILTFADRAASEPISLGERRDLRDRTIFTIDGAGAKDLDDAISLEKINDGWVLGVHIADVSHYVRQKTPVENEARLRGTSVYFTDKVVPMLPESLSNGACSLNAGEDKYALTAEITLDTEGRRKNTVIYKSVIRSVVRGVYEEINLLLTDGTKSEFYEKYSSVYETLQEMHTLYEILKKNSSARGSIELDDREAVIILDENGTPVDVKKRERGDGERLIEQFMLQANMGVAETLRALSLPCLYRVHEKPDDDKLKSFALFVHNLDMNTHGLLPLVNGEICGESAELSPAAIAERLDAILADAEERGISGIVSSVLLRSMMKAKYQSVCSPHFGLGAETYCHFTSPIRRYPDLFVHTVITELMEKTTLRELSATSDTDVTAVHTLSRIAAERGEEATECEIRAQTAEREIEDLYMALYMVDRVGEVFHVTVSSIIRSGMFVECDNLVEGFVPAVCFPHAKIHEERMTLSSGENIFTLGSTLTVRLIDVDVSQGKITFEPMLKDALSTEEPPVSGSEKI